MATYMQRSSILLVQTVGPNREQREAAWGLSTSRVSLAGLVQLALES